VNDFPLRVAAVQKLARRAMSLGLVLLLSVVGSGTACGDYSKSQLSQIWQEHFDLPTGASTGRDEVHSRSSPSTPAKIHRSNQPHPAVARIIVPEGAATSYGSGTLVDIRGKFALVITNWHVVRDAQGEIQVAFPGGFTSQARALKVDPDWDLAALVIWRPPVEPVTIAEDAPSPGDQLTICGYGQGNYRSATGRCTQYYAPRLDFPQHMVELDVEARQGDSGGPIFNDRGQLAGVLFGSGHGTTMGSFGGRVGSFLASLAPDIGKQRETPLELCQIPSGSDSPQENLASRELPSQSDFRSVQIEPADENNRLHKENEFQVMAKESPAKAQETENIKSPDQELATADTDPTSPPASPETDTHIANYPEGQSEWFDQVKTVLAAIGLFAITMQVLRAAR